MLRSIQFPLKKRFLILAAVAAAVPPAAFAQNMFRANLAHTGVYDTAGLRNLKGVKWAFQTGGPVLTSPAIAGSAAYIGSDDRRLYAVDLATGKQFWMFETGGPVRSSPAVVDGTVYFGSYDGLFYALDAGTGKLKWKFETAGEKRFEAKGLHGFKPPSQTIPDFWDTWQSSPAVLGGIVYFGSGDGHLYALDASNGNLRWKFATAGVVHSSPALAGGLVYFGSWDSYLYALDAATGAQKWKFKTGEDTKNFNQVGIQASPAVIDGVVYFGCRDAHLYAVDATTGVEKWNFNNHGTWINASVAVHAGTLYVGTSIPAAFGALDLATGKVRYYLEVQFPVFSSAAVAGDLAYFGSDNGKLHALDLKTGKIVWEFQTEAGKKNAYGVIAPDDTMNLKVIFRSNFFEEMYRDGEKLYSLGSIVSSPAVDRGVVYFGSTDGNLYALE
ncbi:MAG: PQQ-binding-like beta-propeller repeat protein [Bryobacteraceae bacterium]